MRAGITPIDACSCASSFVTEACALACGAAASVSVPASSINSPSSASRSGSFISSSPEASISLSLSLSLSLSSPPPPPPPRGNSASKVKLSRASPARRLSSAERPLPGDSPVCFVVAPSFLSWWSEPATSVCTQHCAARTQWPVRVLDWTCGRLRIVSFD